MQSAFSAKLHYSIGSILICFRRFLSLLKQIIYLPLLDSRLSVLQNRATCTNQFNSTVNEFEGAQHVLQYYYT